MKKTKVIAHRGASAYAPENTLPSFEKAVDVGVDGLELDVHLSKDRELVVIHDERIDRTSNGTGFVKDLTLAKLKKFDFGSWFNMDFCGTRIPTLGEVIELLDRKKWTGLLNIEIKSDIVIYPGIEEKLINIVKANKLEDRVIFSSFNHQCLTIIKKLEEKAEIGLLYVSNIVDPWLYAEYLGAAALHPEFHIVYNNPHLVEKCREKSIAINAYTVDKEEYLRRLFKYKVDGIITNKPDLALKVRKNLSKCSIHSINA
ncbi:MAG: glycerophosphodiester phosphodiesterase [Firmicutes bacterium]|nr:glycerophosphodiester phosphodiesterase [Bacillota bacterium]